MVDRPMAVAEMEARLRDSELSRLRAWEQLQRLRAVLEALCGRRIPESEHRDFEAEGDALVGALYEEVSTLLEDLGRLEAFFGQLRPVIGQPLAGEEAESLRRSMLEHLPQRSLRLGEVRLRLDRAWRSGALPPGAKRRPFASGRRPLTPRDLQPEVGEDPPGPQETVSAAKICGEPRCNVRVKARPRKGQVTVPAGQGQALQATFVWD
jgi:hypothetical protein